MKKVILILTVAVIIMGLSACGGDKYAEAKKLMNQYADATEAYVADLEKVASADDAANALNKYADEMEKLGPKMKALGEKFPELKNQKEPPAEMKAEIDRIGAAMQKMIPAMQKAGQYMMDPKVQEAQQRFTKAMQSMQ